MPNAIFRPNELIDGHLAILDEENTGHNESADQAVDRDASGATGIFLASFASAEIGKERNGVFFS